jgi:hypothetical protein
MPSIVRVFYWTESTRAGAPQGTAVRKYSFAGPPKTGDHEVTAGGVLVRGAGAVEVEIPTGVSVHVEEGGYAEGPDGVRLGALQVVLKAAQGEGGYRFVDAQSARAALDDETAV